MQIDDDEKRQFREAMASLDHPDVDQQDDKPPNTPHWPLPSMSYASPVAAEDRLFYSASELPPQVIRKLKQGHMPIEGRIDLHGLTVDEAHHALGNCIAMNQHDNRRLLLVIHGKGDAKRSMLKTALNHALPMHPHVLAFCSAQPKHGGAGAMYLLLRKPQLNTIN